MAFKSGFGSGAWPAPARVLSCAPCGRPGAVALLGGQIRAAPLSSPRLKVKDTGWRFNIPFLRSAPSAGRRLKPQRGYDPTRRLAPWKRRRLATGERAARQGH